MGRPKRGSLSSFSAIVRQQIDYYRPLALRKSGWSAKIQYQLAAIYII